VKHGQTWRYRSHQLVMSDRDDRNRPNQRTVEARRGPQPEFGNGLTIVMRQPYERVEVRRPIDAVMAPSDVGRTTRGRRVGDAALRVTASDQANTGCGPDGHGSANRGLHNEPTQPSAVVQRTSPPRPFKVPAGAARKPRRSRIGPTPLPAFRDPDGEPYQLSPLASDSRRHVRHNSGRDLTYRRALRAFSDRVVLVGPTPRTAFHTRTLKSTQSSHLDVSRRSGVAPPYGARG